MIETQKQSNVKVTDSHNNEPYMENSMKGNDFEFGKKDRKEGFCKGDEPLDFWGRVHIDSIPSGDF